MATERAQRQTRRPDGEGAVAAAAAIVVVTDGSEGSSTLEDLKREARRVSSRPAIVLTKHLYEFQLFRPPPHPPAVASDGDFHSKSTE